MDGFLLLSPPSCFCVPDSLAQLCALVFHLKMKQAVPLVLFFLFPFFVTVQQTRKLFCFVIVNGTGGLADCLV